MKRPTCRACRRFALGFTTRVLAEAWTSATPTPSTELVWHVFIWRSLGVIGLLLVIFATAELPHLRDRNPLEPGIENTVARLVWSL